MTVRKLDPKTQGNYMRAVKRFAGGLSRPLSGASSTRCQTTLRSLLP